MIEYWVASGKASKLSLKCQQGFRSSAFFYVCLAQRPLTAPKHNQAFSFSFTTILHLFHWHPTLTFINPQAPQVQSQADPKSWQKYQLIKMSHFPCPKKNLLTGDKPKKPKTNQPAITATAEPAINIKSKNAEARLDRYSGVWTNLMFHLEFAKLCLYKRVYLGDYSR